MDPKTLLVITGPTAVGKTSLSIELAKHFHTEILSFDSRQFFKEMKIGTAAPDADQLKTVPHHFIGHLSVQDYYSVFKYEQDALNRLELLFKNHNPVILTGGSGLYLDALIRGMDDIPDPDPEIRKTLIVRLENEGIESLQGELETRDPEYYSTIDIRNPKRVLRGLEVCLTTGKKFSSMRRMEPAVRPFTVIMIIATLPREELYLRINQRVGQMIDMGLVDEARSLLQFRATNALNTVGYRELFGHFDGKFSIHEAVRLIQRNTRHYAKRQITWNRKYEDALRIDPRNLEAIIEWL